MRQSGVPVSSRAVPDKKLLLILGLFMFCLLQLGIASGYLNLNLAALVAVGLLAMPFIMHSAIAAYYIGIPILILLGNLGIRIPFPLFSSPIDFLVTVGIGVGIINLSMRSISLPRSSIYVTIGLFSMVAVVQAYLIHPDVSQHQVAFEKVIRGMWPFWLIVLALHTPRQARYILLVLFGTILLTLLLQLPGFAYAALTNNRDLLRSEEVIATGNYVVDLSLSRGLRTYLFSVPVATLVSFPLALLVLVPRYWLRSIILLVIVTFLSLSSSISSGLASLILSALITLGLLFVSLSPIQKSGEQRRSPVSIVWYVFVVLLFILLMNFLFSRVPLAGEALTRVQNPETDASGASRLELLRETFQVFLSNPIFGGPGEVPWYGGHDSIVSYAANWGLVFSVPYFLSLAIGVRSLVRLLRVRRNMIEIALLAGMIASILANILVSFVTPNILELVADLLVWTFIGLAVVWGSWVEENPDTALY
jgi:hypothetical protein